MYDGDSSSVELPLLARELTETGHYRVVARMYRPDGTLRAFADAPIDVCEGLTTASGTVLDDSGAPLGTGVMMADVRVIDLETGLRVASASVGPDGSFAASVYPGLYGVTGE